VTRFPIPPSLRLQSIPFPGSVALVLAQLLAIFVSRSVVLIMDYPLLNLLFGLALVLTHTFSLGLATLLSKEQLPRWLARAAWVVHAVSVVSGVAVGYLFLQQVPPAINRQLGVGIVCIGGFGALVTAGLNRVMMPACVVPMMVGLQLLTSILGLGIAWALYRSLVPLAPPLME
jgi:hypothetical protein